MKGPISPLSPLGDRPSHGSASKRTELSSLQRRTSVSRQREEMGGRDGTSALATFGDKAVKRQIRNPKVIKPIY